MVTFLLLLFAVWLNPSSAATLGEVETEGGLVQGTNQKMGFFSSVDVFKGIPFAAPPGKWEKPKPHPGWQGVMKATEYRDRCLQVMPLVHVGTIGSEDCLYLNIFVPQGSRLSKNLPVMVYMYGGAFLSGASDDASTFGDSLYDGKEMADRGKVIVITVNYRVGTLGFLSTGDAKMPGNYGLWDQHAAIAWVRRNIEAFGGNPDNITIFGQSSGAASVSYQMLSPYNKGMFQRAITQSGVALSPWAIQRKPMTLTRKIAGKVGCWRVNKDQMIDCLKKTDASRLAMAGKIDILLLLGNGVVTDLLELAPVIDGDFIPDEPSKLFNNAGKFDYLAGVNSMDGHIFAGVDVPSINAKNATTVEEVKRLLSRLTKEKGKAAINSAYSTYTAQWGSTPEPSVVEKTVVDIETDFLFLVPTQTALELHANSTGFKKTFSYVFNMTTRIPGFPEWMEAEHAEELQYLFGKPFTTSLVYLPQHRDLAGYMIAYWTNFAKTGNPNRGNNRVPVTWPQFTKSEHPYLTINDEIDKTSISYDLRKEYVDYWTEIYTKFPTIRRGEE